MRSILSESDIKKLKEKLPKEVVSLIDKYHLTPDTHHVWGTLKEGAYPRNYFKQSFAERNDLLSILFRVYELCGAKRNYYREHLHEYEPYKYHHNHGFVKTELWDMEFLYHKESNRFVDLRYLQSITDIEVFKTFCATFEDELL